jgi:hypothetical protein
MKSVCIVALAFLALVAVVYAAPSEVDDAYQQDKTIEMNRTH